MEDLSHNLEDTYNVLHYGTGIAELGIMGMFMTVFIVSLIISVVVGIVLYILEAIPLYILAKRNGRSSAWLAFVPIFGKYFRLYVLSDIPGITGYTVLDDKVKFSSRPLSFWTYVGIDVFGPALISVVAIFINFIPVLGQILSVFLWMLNFLPAIACGIMEYGYIRDVINLYKEDEKSNRTLAIVVTVLDNLVTQGFARTVCLYTFLKKQPIVKEEGYYNVD